MAPKRSNGGSSSSDSGFSTSNRCSAFSNKYGPYVIGTTAVEAIFIVSMCLVFFLWMRARKRNPSVKHILPWFTFGIAVTFTLVAYTLGLIFYILNSCEVLSPRNSYKPQIPSVLLFQIGAFILLAIIMLPLASAFRRLAHQSVRPMRICNSIILTIVGVILIARIALVCYIYTHIFDVLFSDAITSYEKLSVALDVLWLIACIVASVIFILCLIKAREMQIKLGSLLFWTSTLIALLLLDQIVVLFQDIRYGTLDHQYTHDSMLAFTIVGGVLGVLTFFAVLYTSATPALSAAVVAPTHQVAQAKDALPLVALSDRQKPIGDAIY